MSAAEAVSWRDASSRRDRWRFWLRDFWAFGLKQAWASVFGGILLAAILLTTVWYPENAPLYRYDFLLVVAVVTQVVLIATGMEEPREVIVIAMFHVVATGMELFKTHVGSWTYPEPFVCGFGGVPMFAGFMYSAVGSYIARSYRIFDYRFDRYPSLPVALVLAAAIYVNFFTHHYTFDFRWPLLVGTAVVYGRTWIYFRPNRRHYCLHVLFANFLAAFFIWIAENVGTLGRVWVYPNQHDGWQMVHLEKLVAWYLLLLLSGALVSIVHCPREMNSNETTA